jgi:hypothetical protein
MNTGLKAMAVVGLTGVACLAVASDRDAIATAKTPVWEDITYALLPESMAASGCTGGSRGDDLWPPCPLCPIQMATEFTGTLTLTPHIHVPPGHKIYDVTIEDWIVTFGYSGEPTEVTGEGTYQRWTWTDGNSYQIMMLDLYIYGEEVHFSSGVVEDPCPSSGPYPDIQIALESDTECWGYWFILEAEYVPAAQPVEDAAEAVEAGADAVTVQSEPNDRLR